jgi:hypothetical protein
MSRSRLLFLPAAFALAVGCHSGGEAVAPTSRAETTGAETRGSASDPGAFPEHDARTALNAASRGLKSCRVAGASSSLEAKVLFEPSGKVSAVDVTPTAEPVATCVRRKLVEVAVMPFTGAPVAMTIQVRI